MAYEFSSRESAACGSRPRRAYPPLRSCGRVAEGGGLLNRYRVVKPYRGFESLRLRHPSPCRASGGRPPGDRQGEGCLPKLRQERRETAVAYGTSTSLNSATATSMSARPTSFGVDLHLISKAMSFPRAKYLPAGLRSYVAVADEA